ncbi:MAG: hypothetical protein O7D86_04905, partial [Proteobacteria bacterium]|nr:hypothetical protein [Pseudomonadota bacterium]
MDDSTILAFCQGIVIAYMDNGKDPHHIITGLIRAKMEMIKPFKQKRSGSIMKITTPGLEIAKSDFHYY